MTQVWCADETRIGELIYLGRENLVVDMPDKAAVADIRDRLIAGDAPGKLLGKDATTVPLHSVTKISTDRHDTDIDIEYRDGKDNEEQTLHFASQQARDKAFAALQETYAGRFELFEEAYTRSQAMFMPLAATTICGFLTILFAMAAGEIAAGASTEAANTGAKKLFAAILGFVGPTGVWIVGGLITAFCVLAVYGAAKEPPVMLTLQEAPYKRQSRTKLFVKYALLLAGWAYLAMVAVNWF